MARVLALLVALLGSAPSEQFDRARIAYEKNDYGRVISLVRPLLYPTIQLSSSEQVAEAHRLLGIAFFKTRDEAGAEREFSILLNNNPDFHLDRLVDGAEVAQFVDTMRQKMEDELRRIKELERQREEAERKRKAAEEVERRKHAERIYIERTYTQNPYFVNFLPLGAGQFQNGEKRKGYAFLVGESVLGAASLSLWITKHELYPDGKYPRSDEGTAQTIQVARITTGGAFFALWALGVWDSLKHYQPVVIKESPYIPTPAPLQSGAGLMWQGRF
jgi:hypothetical protein